METAQSLLLLAVTLLIHHVHATPLPQNGDGGGTSSSLPDGSLGYDPSTEGNNGTQPGANGTDSGVHLGKGAIIGISVVAGLIVIAGVTMAILFWGAKKRQWAVAETMRRSVKRVTTGLKALTPRTPHKMTFSPIEKRKAGDIGDDLLLYNNKSSSNKIPRRYMEKSTGANAAVVVGTKHGSNESLDGGEGVQGQVAGTGRKQRPVPPRVQVPRNNNAQIESPKTPMWNRVFGR